MNEQRRPHLSPTQLEMFAKCPEQWRRRYLEGDVIPPGIAMLQGTGVHGGIKVNMRQKRETHKDLPAAEITEVAVEEFKLGVAGGYSLSEEEEGRGSAIVISEAVDAVAEMAEFHAKSQAPDYQPVFVEERVRISLPLLSHDLLGIIDLADDKDRVIDFKTGSKRKSKNDADTSIQLTAYGAAFKAIMGRDAKDFRLDTIVRLKRGAERDVVSTERSEADYQALAARMTAVAHAIKSGSFPPASPGSWWCAKRWCGFATTCRYFVDHGGES